MGKGKKKAKGKKMSGGKKVKKDTNVDDSYRLQLQYAITPEQKEKGRLAAANRTEDPLKNWTRLQNEECPLHASFPS